MWNNHNFHTLLVCKLHNYFKIKHIYILADCKNDPNSSDFTKEHYF